jgi:hypothetical protein
MTGYERFEMPNVQAAIDLASKFKEDGRYDWFRGQRKEWPPYPTAVRLHLAQDAQVLERNIRRIEMFCDWAGGMAELQYLLETGKVHDLYAILQHYGVATNYLDFSTDPAVAAYFACDTPKADAGQVGCIYCLKTADLLDVWETMSQLDERKGAQLEMVTVDVSNLWRLEAQFGVFLYTNYNWDVDYPMDRIVFPNAGYPTAESRERIYPVHKSALEQLLDQYFDTERTTFSNEEWMAWTEELRKRGHTNVSIHRWEAFPEFVYAPAFRDAAALTPHDTWKSVEQCGWQAYPAERFDSTVGYSQVITLATGVDDVASVARSVEQRVQELLRSDPRLRSKAVDWQIANAPASLDVDVLSAMLRRAWNGMRQLPYAAADISACCGRITLLVAARFHEHPQHEERRAHLTQLLGPVKKVAFGAGDGSGSAAWVTERALTACVRTDIESLLTEEEQSRALDIERLLQVIYNPRVLFNFNCLVQLFARDAIPSQVLDTRNLILFNPAGIATFGNP